MQLNPRGSFPTNSPDSVALNHRAIISGLSTPPPQPYLTCPSGYCMFWGPTGPDDDQPNAQQYRVIRILIRVQTRSSRSCVIFHSRKVAAVIHRQTPGWSCHKSHGNSGDSVRNIGRGGWAENITDIGFDWTVCMSFCVQSNLGRESEGEKLNIGKILTHW